MKYEQKLAIEEIVFRLEQAVATFEKDFLKADDKNLLRGYTDLKRSLSYMNKYIKSQTPDSIKKAWNSFPIKQKFKQKLDKITEDGEGFVGSKI